MQSRFFMIIGVGIDITDQQRIKNSIEKFGQRFVEQILTANEIAACSRYRFPVEHYAGKFAVKEAFMKAVSTGLNKIGLQEIEVLNKESGAPYINVYGKAAEIYKDLAVTNMHVTISHDKDMAVAVVILEKN